MFDPLTCVTAIEHENLSFLTFLAKNLTQENKPCLNSAFNMFSVTNKEKIHRHDLGRNKRKSLLWGRLVGDQAGLIYDSHLDTSLKPVTLKTKTSSTTLRTTPTIKLNNSLSHFWKTSFASGVK